LKNNTSQFKELHGEELYVGTAHSESLEMYLKAIWHIAERGNEVKFYRKITEY